MKKNKHQIKKRNIPRIIKLTPEQQSKLTAALMASNLDEDFRELVIGMVDGNRWLSDSLERGQLTTHKLRKLFGLPTEKAVNRKSLVDIANQNGSKFSNIINATGESTSNPTKGIQAEQNNKPQAKGHGCIGSEEYTGATVVQVKLDNLKPKDPCPEEGCDGTVYPLKDPGVFIQITGSPIATATKYELEKLRCNLCGTIFTAKLPENVGPEKYDNSFIAMLMIHKYYAAMPFYRQEQLQKSFGVPLPSSTQWDLINKSRAPFITLYEEFKQIVADAKGICFDDTHAKILEVAISNKKASQKNECKGCYTTGIIGVNDDYSVYLYVTNDEAAGKSVTPILAKRNPELPTPFMMCDALTANIPKTIASDLYTLCFCLVHARRNFYDLPDGYDALAETVIYLIGKIYDIEKRTEGMDDQTRLFFHQKHSAQIMAELKLYLEEQLPSYEPNGIANKAIMYILKRWTELTQFLRHPGTPIDNNITERMLKIPIRSRKSSMFNKTKHGAMVSSYIITAIYTAVRNNVNPYHYLLAILNNQKAVSAQPQQWLPWNYAKLNPLLFEDGKARQAEESCPGCP
jgi:transposase